MKILLRVSFLFFLLISVSAFAVNNNDNNPSESTGGYAGGKNLNEHPPMDLGENANYSNQEQWIKINAEVRKIHSPKDFKKADENTDKYFYDHPENMSMKAVNGVKRKFTDPASIKALEDYTKVASPSIMDVIEGKWTPYQSESQDSNAAFNNFTAFMKDGTFERVLPPSFTIVKGFWSVITFKPLQIKVKFPDKGEYDIYNVTLKDFKTYYLMDLTIVTHNEKANTDVNKGSFVLQKEKSK
ncbi:MAG TPA: hypothetical protein QF753_15785 [Victivallales bacterium]|nr:hypothetical protein [Victivallales bacterium]